VSSIDEGLPIAYEVLEKGVPVYSSDGYEVGTVDHVVAAPEVDIFHGLVVQTPNGSRLVEADQVASLHEHGVDLRIGTAEVSALPEPHGGAPSWRVHEPGAKPSRWSHMLDRFSGADPKRRDWDKR
jgi:sporulation protein YlmC with PRC-barrel domain